MPVHLTYFPSMVLFAAIAIEVFMAARIDVHERRLPHALAFALAITCMAFAVVHVGPARLVLHVLAALSVMCLLVAVEVLWRRIHAGATGLGGGDIKFLAALMLADPFFALVSFSLGLCLLAMIGLLTRRGALPLLPFVAVGCALILLVRLCPWC